MAQPDSPFHIASLSKIFTAAAIARLVALVRVSWNAKAYIGVFLYLLSLKDRPTPKWTFQ